MADDAYTKRVQVIFTNIIEGDNKLNQMTEKYRSLDKKFKNLTTSMVRNGMKQANVSKFNNKWTKKLGLTQAELKNVMGVSGVQFNKFGKAVDLAQNPVKNMEGTLRSGIPAIRRFNMNALGVMFAGMAINRAFGSLNATAREWVGMNELMADMMGIVTLPATLDLLEFGVLPLFDALTNLPESAQYAIGLVTYALQGLGIMMMTTGQFMLGLTSSINLLEKIGGGAGALAGLSVIMSKLGKIGKWIFKYGGTAISLYFAVQDLMEGEVTAAIGMATLGVGIYTGNPYLIGIGLALKFTGDADFQKSFFKVIVSMADKVFALGEWITDTLKKAFTLRWGDIDMTFIANMKDSSGEAFDEMMMDGKISSDTLSKNWIGPIISSNNYLDKLDEISDKYVENTPKWTSAVEELQDEYKTLIDYQDEMIANFNKNQDIFKKMGGAQKSIFGVDYYENPFVSKFVNDAVISPSGNVISTSPDDYLIATKTPESLGGNRDVVMQVTYNVSVSDKKEMESMLRKNNDNLKNEIRRIVKI